MNRPVERGERGKFSRDPQRLGASPSLKNTKKGVPDGFFLTSNMHKIHDPAERAYDTSPDSYSDGEGHPAPHFLPLDAFGVSISPHTVQDCDRAP